MLLDHEVPLVRLFPKIETRDNFINNSHPVINPDLDRTRWSTYWHEEKRRCIEGYWAKDGDLFRWMNPDLYFYINHWTILHKNNQGPEVPIKPHLRDTEWYILCNWTAARGFSGFSEDEEYNGHYLLKKHHQELAGDTDSNGVEIFLTEDEREELESNKWVKDSKGKFKKYKDPYEIIIDKYEYPKGLHLYDNPPEDMMCFSSRSIGKSYLAAAIIGREFTFNGARYSSTSASRLFNIKNTQTVGKAFCGSEQEKHVGLMYEKVFFGLDNFEGGYKTIDKKFPPPFFKQRSGTFSGSDNVITHQYKVYYKIGGKDNRGTGSSMYKGVYSSNINQAIGNRLNVMVIDEAGLILNLPLVHGANRTSMERGGEKTGSMLYIGTGGDIKRIPGSKALFYEPRQNRLRAFENPWEGGKPICMFIPVEYSFNRFKDPQGNTKLEAARDSVLQRRSQAALGADNTSLDSERMYMPIKPSDMFLTDGDLVYNQSKIMDRLSYLERTGEWKEMAKFGEFVELGNHIGDIHVKRTTFDKARPIIRRTVESTASKKGSVIFYREPEGERNFVLKGSRFRVTYDPVRKEGDGPSFASILVWDTKHDDLAAEYIGRRDTPEEVHDICINLALYYSAPILPETNVVGFIHRAKSRGVSYLLYPTPVKALSKKVQGIKYTQGQVGVEMSNKYVKNAAIDYSKTFLYKKDVEGLDVYDKIQSLRLLEEMEIWDGEDNADHISSFLLLSLWEEEEREVNRIEQGNAEIQYKKFRSVLSDERKKKTLRNMLYS